MKILRTNRKTFDFSQDARKMKKKLQNAFKLLFMETLKKFAENIRKGVLQLIKFYH